MSDVRDYYSQERRRLAVAEGSKRFTDTELSAELFRQVFEEAEHEVRGRRTGDPRWVPLQLEQVRRSSIVERFAHAPHFDDAKA